MNFGSFFHSVDLRSRKLLPVAIVERKQGEKLGVENLKLVFTILITFGEDIVIALQRRSFAAMFEVILNLLKFGNIIEIAQVAWLELKDPSLPETEEVIEHFKEELDLENDEVEAKIEAAADLVPEVYRTVMNALLLLTNVQMLWNRIKEIFEK
mgnify:CR=1 FL=1